MAHPPSQSSPDAYDLAISGGTVVLPEGPARTNVGVRDGLIAHIGPQALQARKIIDAAGRLVLPGSAGQPLPHADQQPWAGRSSAR